MIGWLRRGLDSRMVHLCVSLGMGALGIFALLTITVVSVGVGSTRTIVVEAETTGLEITFAGQANDWALGPVTVCVPRPQIDRSLPRGDGQCDARRYLERSEDSLRINWNQNAAVRVTSTSLGGLAFDMSGQTDVENRTRVILSAESWQANGALTFSGTTRIGDQLASGETHMILSGSFEMREKPFGSETTEVLKTGPLRRGESALIMMPTEDGPMAAKVFGHITPAEDSSSRIAVGVVSAPGQVFLQLGFYGAAVPTRISPSWVDRALASPLVLALVAIMSLVLNARQLIGYAASTLKAPAVAPPATRAADRAPDPEP
ncbi:MAG: hypothetical protein ACK4HF_04535 [Paracoccaceae bacterium]